MILKALLAAALSLGLAVAGVMPPLASATEFHTRNLGGQAAAEWSSCRAVAIGEPCTFSIVQGFETFEAGDLNGKRDCVGANQVQGINRDHMFPDVSKPYDFTSTFGFGIGVACGIASVNVSASLTRGEVRGELPGQDCHVVPPTEPTCIPTTLRIALDWRSSGDVSRSPGVVYHQSPISPDERCLEHFLPGRATFNATVTGQVDGFTRPLRELTDAFMAFGGVIEQGTVPDCFD
jgi:hypothetical protein